MAGMRIYLEVDASDLKDKIDKLQAAMKPEQFNRAMYGIFRRTGGHVRKILRQDLPQQYNVKPGGINKAVGGPKLTMGGLGTSCTIPIRDARRGIGGSGGFGAYGGQHGWNAVRRKRKYKIKANIVRAGMSELPEEAESKFPPFRNIGSVLGGKAYARRSKARGPLVRIKGIAIPQMPMNRSATDVQKDIKDFMERQMEQRFMALMRIGK